MNIEWTTDETGRMLGFSIHDASLIGLQWDEMQYIRMRLRTVDGIKTVEFYGLDTATLQQIWNGAILSDLYIWPIGAVPETVWKVSDGAWHILLSGRTHPSDARSFAERIIKRKPSAFLVQAEFSYGGAFAVVCDQINVRTET